jgi:hypothetical protein
MHFTQYFYHVVLFVYAWADGHESQSVPVSVMPIIRKLRIRIGMQLLKKYKENFDVSSEHRSSSILQLACLVACLHIICDTCKLTSGTDILNISKRLRAGYIPSSYILIPRRRTLASGLTIHPYPYTRLSYGGIKILDRN